MKQIIIKVPDNCELKQVGNTYTIVEKEKKLTYDDVARKLFSDNDIHYYIDSSALINTIVNGEFNYICKNNANSKKQLEKLLAINMLMNVAKYLNDGWQPNWSKEEEGKYYIQIENVSKNLSIDCTGLFNIAIVYFKSEELAEQAIEILGEETIKLALCTNY